MSITKLFATLDGMYDALPADDRIHARPSAGYMTDGVEMTIDAMLEMVGDDEAAIAAIDAALDAAAAEYPGSARRQEYTDLPHLSHWFWDVPAWDRRPCTEKDRCRRTLTARMLDLFSNGTYPC